METLKLKAEYQYQFATFTEWVNKAASWSKSHNRRRQHIYVDAAGNVLEMGKDFNIAKAHNLFPVKVYALQTTEDYIEAEQQYYLISLKHSSGGHYTFWRADDKGYTNDLQQAGVYAESKVLKFLSHYHNGEDTVAIKCQDIKKFFCPEHVEYNYKIVDKLCRLAKLNRLFLPSKPTQQ
jgi:hypothetical protein